MKYVDPKIVVSVLIGIAAFGAAMAAINMLPGGNIVTDSVKKAAEIVND